MRGRQVRSFLVILGITALVWLAMALSESHEYSLPVKVRFSGYDAKRYAVVHIDTSLILKVEATGFNALFYSLRREPLTVQPLTTCSSPVSAWYWSASISHEQLMS